MNCGSTVGNPWSNLYWRNWLTRWEILFIKFLKKLDWPKLFRNYKDISGLWKKCDIFLTKLEIIPEHLICLIFCFLILKKKSKCFRHMVFSKLDCKEHEFSWSPIHGWNLTSRTWMKMTSTQWMTSDFHSMDNIWPLIHI